MPKKQVRRKLSSLNCDVISLIGRHSDSGIEGRFFKMSKTSKFGIKAYNNFDDAQCAYEMQQEAAKMGVGPKVGKMLIIYHRERKQDENIDIWYGYETQVAQPVIGGFRSSIWKEQHREVERKLDKIGCGGDFCPRNCGIIKGKLVCVDFGGCSILSRS